MSFSHCEILEAVIADNLPESDTHSIKSEVLLKSLSSIVSILAYSVFIWLLIS